MWGHNKSGQCGVYVTNRSDNDDSILYPRPVDLNSLKSDLPVSLVCGRNHSACITDRGRVYTWGSAGYGRLGQMDAKKKEVVPAPVTYFMNKNVRQIASGDYHMLALGIDGNVYSWGFSADVGAFSESC